ncbi:unnamed protein product [Blepharisma stoltei]|uniref:Uncharacterized protein n=1 Tax=Blepharisma stoltei TaxID=1481888 RepID=A0AAU9JLJ6_9CILI|nr:unnamed protein product [Blepharisma stoltei]
MSISINKRLSVWKSDNSFNQNSLSNLSPRDLKPPQFKIKISTYYTHQNKASPNNVTSLNFSPKWGQEAANGLYKLSQSGDFTPYAPSKPFKFPHLPISLSNKIIKKHKKNMILNSNLLARGVSLNILPNISPYKRRVIKSEVQALSTDSSHNKRWNSCLSSITPIKRAIKIQTE